MAKKEIVIRCSTCPWCNKNRNNYDVCRLNPPVHVNVEENGAGFPVVSLEEDYCSRHPAFSKRAKVKSPNKKPAKKK